MNYIYNKVLRVHKKTSLRKKRLVLLAAFFTLHASLFTLYAQDKIVNPDISAVVR